MPISIEIRDTNALRDIAAAHSSLLQGIAALVTAFGSTDEKHDGIAPIVDAAVEIANNAVNSSKMLIIELELADEASQAVDSSAIVTDSDDDDDDEDSWTDEDDKYMDEDEDEDGDRDGEENDDDDGEEEGGGIQRFAKGTVWMYDPPANRATVEIISVDVAANTCVLKSIDPDDFQRIYTDVPLNELGPNHIP